MNESENQFSLTRVAPVQAGAQKANSYQCPVNAGSTAFMLALAALFQGGLMRLAVI